MCELDSRQAESILGSSIQQISPYRNHWLVETNAGKWMAKKGWDAHRHAWWHCVDEELRLRGFGCMPSIRTDGSKWIFTSFIEGESSSYTHPKEVARSLAVLAHFHRASQGLTVAPPRKKGLLFRERLYRRLEQFYHVVNSAQHLQGELGEVVRDYGRAFYSDGFRAWKALERLPLQELIDRDYRERNLTHRDLASHNWMIDEVGRPWLIDWDTAAYDLQLGDVWQMSARILTENEWSDAWVDQVLLQYASVRPLSEVEKYILIVLFAFPNEFYREVSGLALSKKGYQEGRTLPYIRKIISGRAQWKKQLKRLGNW